MPYDASPPDEQVWYHTELRWLLGGQASEPGRTSPLFGYTSVSCRYPSCSLFACLLVSGRDKKEGRIKNKSTIRGLKSNVLQACLTALVSKKNDANAY